MPSTSSLRGFSLLRFQDSDDSGFAMFACNLDLKKIGFDSFPCFRVKWLRLREISIAPCLHGGCEPSIYSNPQIDRKVEKQRKYHLRHAGKTVLSFFWLLHYCM